MSRAVSLLIAESRLKSVLTHRAASAVALLAVLAMVITIGALGQVEPAVFATQTAAGVSGFGFMVVLGCIGCLAGFLIGAGTTIAGLAVFLAAHPELAILCATTCVAAVS